MSQMPQEPSSPFLAPYSVIKMNPKSQQYNMKIAYENYIFETENDDL